MIQMSIFMDGDGCWPDLGANEKEVKDRIDQGKLIWLGNGAAPMQVALLDNGMQSGSPSVAIRLDLPDGKTVVAETTLKLFVSAARMFFSRYPHLLD